MPRINDLGASQRVGLLDGALAGRSNTHPFPGGQVAQLVEQRTENPRVGGSIPPLATNINEIDDQFLAISLILCLPD